MLFLVLIEGNKPQEVIQILKNKYGLSGSVVAKDGVLLNGIALLVQRTPHRYLERAAIIYLPESSAISNNFFDVHDLAMSNLSLMCSI